MTLSFSSCADVWALAHTECSFQLSSKWPSPGLQSGHGYLYYRLLLGTNSTAQRVNLTCPPDHWAQLVASTPGGLAPCGAATINSGQQLVAALEALQKAHERVFITLDANVSLPTEPTPPREAAPADDVTPLATLYRNVTLVGAVRGATELDMRMRRNAFQLAGLPLGDRPSLVFADLATVNVPQGPPSTWPLGLLSFGHYYVGMNRTGVDKPYVVFLRCKNARTVGEMRYLTYWSSRIAALLSNSSTWTNGVASQTYRVQDLDGRNTTASTFQMWLLAYNTSIVTSSILGPLMQPQYDLWSFPGALPSPDNVTVAVNATSLCSVLQGPWLGGGVVLVTKNVTLPASDGQDCVPEQGYGSAAAGIRLTLAGPVSGSPVSVAFGTVASTLLAAAPGPMAAQYLTLQGLPLLVRHNALAAAPQRLDGLPEYEPWRDRCLQALAARRNTYWYELRSSSLEVESGAYQVLYGLASAAACASSGNTTADCKAFADSTLPAELVKLVQSSFTGNALTLKQGNTAVLVADGEFGDASFTNTLLLPVATAASNGSTDGLSGCTLEALLRLVAQSRRPQRSSRSLGPALGGALGGAGFCCILAAVCTLLVRRRRRGGLRKGRESGDDTAAGGLEEVAKAADANRSDVQEEAHTIRPALNNKDSFSGLFASSQQVIVQLLAQPSATAPASPRNQGLPITDATAAPSAERGREPERVLADEIHAMIRRFQPFGTPNSGTQGNRLLGKGGHGAVYLGEWRGMQVAVKLVLLSATDGAQRRERLAREVALTTALSHPYVVPTYHHEVCPLAQPEHGLGGFSGESSVVGFSVRIVMQHCEGGTLRDALRSGLFRETEGSPLSRSETRNLSNGPSTAVADTAEAQPSTLPVTPASRTAPFAMPTPVSWDDLAVVPNLPLALLAALDVARGLAYLHSCGVVHGDLTDNNVLVKHAAPGLDGRASALASGTSSLPAHPAPGLPPRPSGTLNALQTPSVAAPLEPSAASSDQGKPRQALHGADAGGVAVVPLYGGIPAPYRSGPGSAAARAESDPSEEAAIRLALAEGTTSAPGELVSGGATGTSEALDGAPSTAPKPKLVAASGFASAAKVAASLRWNGFAAGSGTGASTDQSCAAAQSGSTSACAGDTFPFRMLMVSASSSATPASTTQRSGQAGSGMNDGSGRLEGLRRQTASGVAPERTSWMLQQIFKISDFGLSVQLERADQTHLSNMHQGTPFFAAPEVVAAGHLSRSADVYSFGVVLWSLLHGVPVVDLRPQLPSPLAPLGPELVRRAARALPPRLHSLLRRCLSLQPGGRPEAAELEGELRQAMEAAAGPDLAWVLQSVERREQAPQPV